MEKGYISSICREYMKGTTRCVKNDNGTKEKSYPLPYRENILGGKEKVRKKPG